MSGYQTSGGRIVPAPRVDYGSMSWFRQEYRPHPTVGGYPRPAGTLNTLAGTARLLWVLASALLVYAAVEGWLGPWYIPAAVLVGYHYVLRDQSDYRWTWWVWTLLGGFLLGARILNEALPYPGNPDPSWGDIPLYLALWGIPVLAKPFMIAQVRRDADPERAAPFPLDDLLGVREYGVGGAGVAEAAHKFGAANTEIGALGERMTADVLRPLLRIPGVQIIHGLYFPWSTAADVDHAVIRGNRVALIDTKLYGAAHYHWGEDGNIAKGDSYRGRHELHFPAAVEGYRVKLDDRASVHGWVMIHPISEGDHSVTAETGPAGVRLGDPQTVINEVGHWLSLEDEGSPDIDPALMRLLWTEKKGGRDQVSLTEARAPLPLRALNGLTRHGSSVKKIVLSSNPPVLSNDDDPYHED